MNFRNVLDESNQYQLKPPETTTNKINEEDFEDLSLGDSKVISYLPNVELIGVFFQPGSWLATVLVSRER